MKNTEFAKTKTLRFKLAPVYNESENTLSFLINKTSKQVDLNNFAVRLRAFIQDAKNHFFVSSNNGNEEIIEIIDFKPTIEYDYKFLKIFFKRQYYAFLINNKDKKYSLKMLEKEAKNSFIKVFQDCFDSLELISVSITDFVLNSTEKQYDKKKNEVMAFNLKKLSKKNGLFLIHSCLENLKGKASNNDLLKRSVELINETEILSEQFLDTGSEGITIFKASFNYYTINKSPKQLDKAYEDICDLNMEKVALEDIVYAINQINCFSENNNVINLVSAQVCKNLNLDASTHRYIIKKSIEDNIDVLEAIYQYLKQNKAFYKQALYELSSKNVDYLIVKSMTIKAFFNQYKSSIDQENDQIYWNTLQNGLNESSYIKPFENLKEDLYKILIDRGDELNKLNDELSHTINEDVKKTIKKRITKSKKDRGIVFNRTIKNNSKLDATFNMLCDKHQKIAIKYGQQKAMKKAIEKEKAESDLTKYWSVIYKLDGQFLLVLIPLQNRNEFYNHLKTSRSTTSENRIYYFESLTYKALEKLCFNYEQTGQRNELNSFWKGVSTELTYEFKRINRLNKPEKFYRTANYLISDNERIRFFKEVLNTNYAKSVLLIPEDMKSIIDFDENMSFELFQQEINKIGYKRIVKADVSFEYLKNEYNALIFKIDNFDLQKQSTKRNNHSNIWLNFWDQSENSFFPLRLNPEISIAYRKPRKEEIYGKDSEKYKHNWHNRYRDEQFILRTTFTNNAFSKQFDFSFETIETVKEKVNHFSNNTLINEYTIGIDLGSVELATLALIKQEKPFLFDVYEIKPDKLGFSQTGIASHGKKEYFLIQNLSYFTNEDLYNQTFKTSGNDIKNWEDCFNDLFFKKEVSALDLTLAKVISNRIFTNGDIQTILNLKVLDVKYQVIKALQERNDVIYRIDQGKNGFSKLNFYSNDEKITSFKYQSEFNYLPIIQDWQFPETYKMGGLKLISGKKPENPFDYLKLYFEDFMNNEVIDNENLAMEKINNYRKNMVANMIGVIHYLYKKYTCNISFENFDINKNKGAQNKYEATIYNILVNKTIQKFYFEGTVPPLKSFYDLKEVKNDINAFERFGNMLFVSEIETSTLCPSCGYKSYRSQEDKKFRSDKENKVFHCSKEANGGIGDCGFHNHKNPGDYFSLDDNDKIAAFNIAKRGFETIKKLKND